MAAIARKKLIAVLLILFFSGSYARCEEEAVFVDGEAWEDVSGLDLSSDLQEDVSGKIRKAQKIAYIRGVYESLKGSEIIVNRRSPLLQRIPDIPPDRLIEELDVFYNDYGNKSIPVLNALIVIERKNRAVSKEQINKEIDSLKEANINIETIF